MADAARFRAFAALATELVVTLVTALATVPASASDIGLELRTEFSKPLRQREFASDLARWKARYGDRAVSPLIGIALDRRVDPLRRYQALTSAAQLSAPGDPSFLSMLNAAHQSLASDRSWLVRLAYLRTLEARKSPRLAAYARERALNDPALVIRQEASLLQPGASRASPSRPQAPFAASQRK